jgi:hypothetical protein
VWALGEVWTYPKKKVPEEYRTHTQAYHWNGQRWQQVPLPQPGERGCYGIAEIAGPDDIWATGLDPCASGEQTAIAAHWNGKVWTNVPLPKLVSLTGVVTLGPDEVWALGECLQTRRDRRAR